MKIGILGAGSIAATMAETLGRMENVQCHAVGARDGKRAEAFAQKYGFQRAYGSYEELASDEEVELIYIATPHSHHYEHAKLCMEHNKPVLCEKAFTATAAQAKELLALSEERKVFLAEAIWTRYMPSKKLLRDLIDSGIIGEVTSLTANLGYVIDHVPRMKEPSLAGGAMLDLGVYPLNFACMIFDGAIKKITSAAVLTDKGVDLQNTVILTYEDGKMAAIHSTMAGKTDRRGIIHGRTGYIEAENINNIESIKAYDLEGRLLKEVPIPEQISGYEYQVEASIRAISSGKIACEEMPHEEIGRMMEIMDSLRREWGVISPF